MAAVARFAAEATTPEMVSASMMCTARGRGVALSRRESKPAPRAVSSAPAAVFVDGAMEPNAPVAHSSVSLVHARARASQKRLRGDASDDAIVDMGESACVASKGPAGVTSNDFIFVTPTPVATGIVAISRRGSRAGETEGTRRTPSNDGDSRV